MFNFVANAFKNYMPTSKSLYNKSSTYLDNAYTNFNEGMLYQEKALKDFAKVSVKGAGLALSSYSMFNLIPNIIGLSYSASASMSFVNLFAQSSKLSIIDNLLTIGENWMINNCQYLPMVSLGVSLAQHPFISLSLIGDGVNFLSNEYYALKHLIPASVNLLEGISLKAAGAVVESFEQLESAYNLYNDKTNTAYELNTFSKNLDLSDFQDEIVNKKQSLLAKEDAYQNQIDKMLLVSDIPSEDLSSSMIAIRDEIKQKAQIHCDKNLAEVASLDQTLDLIADWDVVEFSPTVESLEMKKDWVTASDVMDHYNFEESFSPVLGDAYMESSMAA